MNPFRIARYLIAVIASPFLCYSLGYLLMFVLFGRTYPGGGDRAFIGFITTFILLIPYMLIWAAERDFK